MFNIVALSALLVWFVVMLAQNIGNADGSTVVSLAALAVSTSVILAVSVIRYRKRKRESR